MLLGLVSRRIIIVYHQTKGTAESTSIEILVTDAVDEWLLID